MFVVFKTKNSKNVSDFAKTYSIRSATFSCAEVTMIVTADERRKVLNLFNVSEAARQLGVDVFQLHRDIKSGRVPSPNVRLGRRLYFGEDDLIDLRTHYKREKNNDRFEQYQISK